MYINSLGQQLRNKLDMLYEIERQQTCASTALRLLKQNGLDAVILGGAPRDWLHDRPAKDLDIYIELKTDFSFMATIELIEKALCLEPYELQDITTQSDYLRNKENGVKHVFNVLNLAMPAQIILCDRAPMEMLKVFHGSLSQAYAEYSKALGFRVEGTKVFELCKRFGIHLVKKDDDQRYITKVADKYPTYKTIYELA